MKHYAIVVGAAILAFSALSGCSLLTTLFGSKVTLDSRPPLPVPSCYICHVPNTSSILVLDTKTMTLPFTPTVSQVIFKNQSSLTNVTPQTVALTDSSGALYGNPVLSNATGVSNPGTLQPLQTPPLIQIVDFWQKVGSTQRYPNGTTTSYTTSVTTGTTTTSTNSMELTLGLTLKLGGSNSAFQASVSSQFSDTWTNSVQLSSSQTSSQTFTASPSPGHNLVYVVWQLIYEVRIVRRATAAEVSAGTDDGTGYVLYNDPNYTFVDPQTQTAYVDPVTGLTLSGIAPVELQQTVIVPSTTSF